MKKILFALSLAAIFLCGCGESSSKACVNLRYCVVSSGVDGTKCYADKVTADAMEQQFKDAGTYESSFEKCYDN